VLDQHDRHILRAHTHLVLVCTFWPALTGGEKHDADGSYLPAETSAG
jgi:L-ectoine synthase